MINSKALLHINYEAYVITFLDHTDFSLWYLVFQLSGKYIRINGATMIKTGGPLWLSCFSNIPFMVRKVQFYANDDLFITLNQDIYGCRSSAINGICEPDQCHCSKDGKTYSVKHQGFPVAGNVSLQCKMEFELALEMTDCIIVNAIGMFINWSYLFTIVEYCYIERKMMQHIFHDIQKAMKIYWKKNKFYGLTI